MRYSLSIGLMCCSALLSTSLCAAKATKVATIDRSAWPEKIKSVQDFDRASVAEILSFTSVIAHTPMSTHKAIQALTSEIQVNTASVDIWRTTTQWRLIAAFQHATHSTQIAQWTDLVAYANQHLPTYDQTWRHASQRFYQTYLYEQVRLASLFPRITSEIAVLTENEISGFKLQDGQFLLSFDDGPHPVNTPKLLRKLNTYQANAWFFVEGKLLRNEKNTALYKKQCLGTHGWTHVRHTHVAKAMRSINKSEQLIKHYESKNPVIYFRPPYGQRSFKVSHALARNHQKVVLWNIDSQDWNHQITSRQIRDRVMTLMLLWRKGIVLFHDAYPKANMVLDDITAVLTASGHAWGDCSSIISPINVTP